MFEVNKPTIYFKSSEKMEEVADKSIQLIVTSPPYGKIKDYGKDEQIGFFDSFEQYFRRLNAVWKECYRILEPQCRLVINVGDQYLRAADHERYRIISISSKIVEDCVDVGFDFLGDIIWQKVSTTNTTGGCSLMGSIYYPRNGLLTYDYEHVLIFKKYEGKGKQVDLKRKELSKISLSEWKKWFIGHWRFPGIMQKEHLAMFPEELPYRIIRMFSHIGDTILDPFVGSGTTLKVAKALFRKSIGYELNQEYEKIIQAKISDSKPGYFQDYQYLLYRLYEKSLLGNFSLDYSKQKQKGILVIRNLKDEEIILDYLLLDKFNTDPVNFTRELKNKMKENTVLNYLKSKKNWESFLNYVIVVNSEPDEHFEYVKKNLEKIDQLEKDKRVTLIDFNDIVSDQYNILDLFP